MEENSEHGWPVHLGPSEETMHTAYAGSACFVCAAVGIMLGHFIPTVDDALWTAGALLFVAGVPAALLLSTRERAPRVRSQADAPADDRAQADDGRNDGVPPIGEMLVNYGLLSSSDLQKALARQKKSGKRLGQILVGMHLVTLDQVLAVLEEQHSRRAQAAIQKHAEST